MLLFGIYGGLIQWLQSVQNTVARLITGAPRRDQSLRCWDSSTVACETENWLQIGGACLQSLHGLALPYLLDDCQLITDVGRRHLRSSDVYTCRPMDTVSDWRQEFYCSQTAATEQPTDKDPEERHYICTL